MKRQGERLLLGTLVVVTLVAAAAPALAQIPDEFTNLKVLDKDIDKRELLGIMREFSGALGVRCTHCHKGETPGSLEGVDFATDELEAKRVARGMMKMVDEIGGKLLPAAGVKSSTRVRCVTCHRGLESPETLDNLLLAQAESGGAEAAVKKYRELRSEYYGKGSYAFDPGTLSGVAESLAREKGDTDGAIALMQLSVEFDPDVASSHMMLGQLQMMKGDREAAVASLERAVRLDPENQRAKQMLERVRAPE